MLFSQDWNKMTVFWQLFKLFCYLATPLKTSLYKNFSKSLLTLKSKIHSKETSNWVRYYCADLHTIILWPFQYFNFQASLYHLPCTIKKACFRSPDSSKHCRSILIFLVRLPYNLKVIRFFTHLGEFMHSVIRALPLKSANHFLHLIQLHIRCDRSTAYNNM